jgi:aminoglycoside phosphotransferase (APT) family kinase protein
LAAIAPAAVAPNLLGFCDDPQVIGTPFMVMSFVAGTSITDTLPQAYRTLPDAVDRLGGSLIDAIAAVHRIDWRRADIKFGDPAQFVRRQVERWLLLREAESVRELPLLHETAQWLLSNMPIAAAPAIVHGDFHLDNTLSRLDRPELAAIIDWELASIADPLIDVALLLMFWGERGVQEPAFAHVQKVTRGRAVSTRRELAERWATLTGRSIEHLDFYGCFAFWRLAAMVEGSYVLYRRGGTNSDYARDLEFNVPRLLQEAAAVISQGSSVPG